MRRLRAGTWPMPAGLQALRDRLTVDQAAQLSAQLPLLLRGVFFEGWVPKDKPLHIRHKAVAPSVSVPKTGSVR